MPVGNHGNIAVRTYRLGVGLPTRPCNLA